MFGGSRLPLPYDRPRRSADISTPVQCSGIAASRRLRTRPGSGTTIDPRQCLRRTKSTLLSRTRPSAYVPLRAVSTALGRRDYRAASVGSDACDFAGSPALARAFRAAIVARARYGDQASHQSRGEADLSDSGRNQHVREDKIAGSRRPCQDGCEAIASRMICTACSPSGASGTVTYSPSTMSWKMISKWFEPSIS